MVKSNNEKYEPLPVRGSSQIKEDDSRQIFQKQIKPWMISSWTERDFGIDAIIEITQPISNSDSQIVTGKRFSVQLKSSTTATFSSENLTLSVPKEKITYWYQAIEPVLLIYIDLNEEESYFRWIDENLINELNQKNANWIAQKTISVRFNKEETLSKNSLSSIEDYVLNWRRPATTILTPGNYFKYNKTAQHVIQQFTDLVQDCDISILESEIDELKQSTSKSIYTIAIVGPTNAGKSMLINSLLQKEISPIGMLPTTGIPITIFPGSEDKSVVLFKDEREVRGGIDQSFLEQYTSKDHNPDNRKDVKLVSVTSIDSLLEKGFAICDVPGLDDPDQEIRNITTTALYNVNAIIYVVSTGTMASGDFSLNKQIIDNLRKLGGKMDRLFLVLNKVDLLTNEQLEFVRKHVDETLEKHGITNYLPTPPIYLSAKESCESRLSSQATDDSVQKLEKVLWEYLLSHNKTGLHRILGSLSDCSKLIEKHKNIIKTRQLDSSKREDLESEISSIWNEMDGLRDLVKNSRLDSYEHVKSFVLNSFNNVINHLDTELNNVPLNLPLPSSRKIILWLERNSFQILSEGQDRLQQDIYGLQSDINQWISSKLDSLEIDDYDDTNNTIELLDANRYTNQVYGHYQGKTGYLGMLEGFFNWIESVFKGLFDAVDDFISTKADVRKKRIRMILDRASHSYKKVYSNFTNNLNQYLSERCRYMEEKSIDRAKFYLDSLSKQLEKLDEPVTNKERQNFENFNEGIVEIESQIKSAYSNLKIYTEDIVNK